MEGKVNEAKRVASQAQDKASNVASKAGSEAEDVSSTARAHGQDATSQVQSTAEGTSSANNVKQAAITKEEGKRVAADKADVASNVAEDKKNKLKDAYGNLVSKVCLPSSISSITWTLKLCAETWPQKIPEEHKDKARQARDDTKDYMNDKFPKERRDRFIYRLKKVIVEQQRHWDYQEAMLVPSFFSAPLI